LLKLGIIGQPLTHSLSPVLHATLMHLLKLDGEYRKYELKPAELAGAIPAFAKDGIRGLNVTIPHKVTVMSLMDWLSPEAELAGAVNTIVFEQDGAHKKGYNTDITGFMRGLPAAILDRLPESNVLVLGAGGSARAVITGLIQAGCAAITLAVRDPNKAVALLSHAEVIKQAYRQNTQMATFSLHSLPSLEGFNGIINTTPLGMWPDVAQSPLTPIQLETLPAGSFVYDLIYRPTETRLLQDAAALGYHTINGLDMLLYQGISAFELWQAAPVPDEVIAPVRQQLLNAVNTTAS
jgi:shikimate dehydrogenase